MVVSPRSRGRNSDGEEEDSRDALREEYGHEDSESEHEFTKKLTKVGLGKLGKGRGFEQAAVTDEKTEEFKEKEMLELEPDRTLPPLFPYEDHGALSVPNIKKVTSKDVVWNDPKFLANEDAIFDKRITRRLENNTLPYKFRMNRERYARKID